MAPISDEFSVKLLDGFRNARGFVFEPVNADGLLNQRNCHVAITAPGCVRGNHYHPKGTEICVVCGPALVRVRHQGETKDFPVEGHEVKQFVFPPGMPHAIRNDSPTSQFLISFATIPHTPEAPNLVREVLI
ncbi:MAG: cupin domain-containing protein [Verrucomicrobia bacterium]|nr:cupin domain-containing protein [Verrucomicrobiota bacterium]